MKNTKHLTKMIISVLLISGIATSVQAISDNAESKEPFLHFDFGTSILKSNQTSETSGVSTAAKSNSDAVTVMEEAEVTVEKMLYYYISNDNNFYQLTEDQFNEVILNKNIQEVTARDNVAAIGKAEENKSLNTANNNEENYYLSDLARITGRWTFDHDLDVGVKMWYSRPGGAYFVVDTGESIMFSLRPDQPCSLSFGVTGTTTYDESAYIDQVNYFGITLASDNPGSYKFYCKNNSDVDLTVSGAIDVD